MQHSALTTESRYFTTTGWARFMSAGYFGMVKILG